MTTIVGLVENGIGYIGCDTQLTAGYQRLRVADKVHQHKRLHIGVSGMLRLSDLTRSNLAIFDTYQDDRDSVVSVIVPALRQVLRDNGYLAKHDEVESAEVGDWLLVSSGAVFEIGVDFSVAQAIDDTGAIGSGANYALGALAVLDKKLKPATRIRRALEAAARYDIYTSAPFMIYTVNAPEDEALKTNVEVIA